MNFKKKLAIGLSLVLTSTMAFAQLRPFGAGDGIKYGNKLVDSDQLTQDDLNKDVQTFYDRWTGAENGIEYVDADKPLRDGYLAKYNTAIEKPMYVVKGDSKGSEPAGWKSDNPGNPLKAISTSEATGYGMIATVLMAGYDENAQMYFDGLMNTYLNNLTSTVIGFDQLHTMSWVLPDSLTNRDGTPYDRTTSSSDGDLDIAYALLLASEQWETPSHYATTSETYLELAKALIQDIHDYLISDTTSRVLMGDWHHLKGEDDLYNHSVTRPSDWMITHFRVFNKVVPSPKWQAAIDEIYRILPEVDVYQKGLIPDFVEDINGIPSPVRKPLEYTDWVQDEDGNWVPVTKYKFLETEHDDKYDNNACRAPWRMALDYIHNGGAEPKHYLQRVNAWSENLPQRKLRKDWSEGSNDTWMNDPDNGYEMSTFPKSVNMGYYLDGVSILQKENGPEWIHMQPSLDFHFVSPIGFAPVGGDNKDVSMAKLETTWELVTDEWSFGGDNMAKEDEPYTCYFGDSITLLEMLAMSGNWWEPKPDPIHDEWTPGIFYVPGDIVMYNGQLYECTYYDVASKPGREPDQPWMWAVWSPL